MELVRVFIARISTRGFFSTSCFQGFRVHRRSATFRAVLVWASSGSHCVVCVSLVGSNARLSPSRLCRVWLCRCFDGIGSELTCAPYCFSGLPAVSTAVPSCPWLSVATCCCPGYCGSLPVLSLFSWAPIARRCSVRLSLFRRAESLPVLVLLRSRYLGRARRSSVCGRYFVYSILE